ncbi:MULTISPECIES: ImmA/IrrE family metallo-endopeptidase [Rhodobacterales]|uniref:ImmA/IrrE family metallo-endopeptidase n=1 Tax=Pseudodonghicola flavimaris TaxID=3050036 RepID=A0ABT7F6K4_9RHOB|nr:MULTISPECIES: ImmA/IrrE family metallo-endopeptidase [Rhodobacterales]MCA1288622.1 ImmA/IrrE family metallo-endopeptidase [Salipiger bermudensis]MDK3020024.1 ImmA/IrrE family metallo-endopeptidase [Pseudodonghicola flavimaris]
MNGITLNEKEAREARARISRLSEALHSEHAMEPVVAGLPPEVVSQVSRMMKAERERLTRAVEAYEVAKETQKPTALKALVNQEPGLMLIVARIANGYSQKDLAWRLGVKEQQVQRWEAERYGQISLKNYNRVAALLGVRLTADMPDQPAFRGLDKVIDGVSKSEIKKILKHGRENGWFAEDFTEAELRRYIAENRIDFGSPGLLRTGLNVVDHTEDVMLHAWRARVTARAREAFASVEDVHEPLELKWMPGLVRLSNDTRGPLRAVEVLADRGIVLIVEPQVPGLKIDGAAFIVDGRPVIGMTVRTDTVDNFWFTLMHELAHVTLHFSTGLAVGFYDQTDQEASVDEQEEEANRFASNLLIPEERWRRSTARIAKSAAVIERFADELGIHPAIVFGRIRKERGEWSLFANKIGRNTVRKLFVGEAQKGKSDAPILPGPQG